MLLYLVSARRPQADLLICPFLPDKEKFGYYFSDLNLKTNVAPNNNNWIYLSGYWGADRLQKASLENTQLEVPT